MKLKFLSLLFITLTFFLISTTTKSANIDFDAHYLSKDELFWSFQSDDPRPLLYLVGFKLGQQRPRNCDEATNLYAVRDVLTVEEGRWNPKGEESFHIIFCAFNIHGHLESQSIISFK